MDDLWADFSSGWRTGLLDVVETSETATQLRLIVSSPSAGQSWDLRCLLREGVIAFLQRTQPQALPRTRAEVVGLPPRRPPGDLGSSLAPAAVPTSAATQSQGAAVNNDTGMASLAAPTGGRTPATGVPK